MNGKSINDMFPNINMQDADISKKAKVGNLWRDGRWKFPDAVDDVALQAWEFITNNFKIREGIQDKIIWKASPSGIFSISSAYKALCGPDNPVS